MVEKALGENLMIAMAVEVCELLDSLGAQQLQFFPKTELEQENSKTANFDHKHLDSSLQL